MKKNRKLSSSDRDEGAVLSRVLTEDLRTAVSVAKSTISSLDPSEIDEQVLVSMAKSALADLDAAVERWAVIHELEEQGGAPELLEPRGLVEDVLRELLAEFEAKDLQISVDDDSGFREVLVERRRLAVALRGILEAIVLEAQRGERINISIRFVNGAPGGNENSDFESDRALHRVDRSARLIIEATHKAIAESLESVSPRVEFADEEAIGSRSRERRWIGLAIAKRLISGPYGSVSPVSDHGRGQGFAISIPLDA